MLSAVRLAFVTLATAGAAVSGGARQTPGLQAPAAGPSQVFTPAPPDVHPDSTVTFRVLAPQAGHVGVFLDTMQISEATALTKDDRGVWSGTVGPFAPDLYGYGFVVDGAGITGGMVDIVGRTPQAWDVRKVPHGTIHVHWYDSKSLNLLRSVYVYTPPGYERTNTTYPVLYLLHGSGGTEDSWINVGPANVILDNLIADNKARPMVVVMPFGHPEPSPRAGVAPTFTARDLSGFSRDLVDDIMPLVERTYRVSRQADDRAIAGFSMGGNQARTIGLTRLDLFHSVASFSGTFSVQGTALTADALEGAFPDVFSDTIATNSTLRVLWFACGKAETALVAQNQVFADALARHQIRYTFVTIEGGHTWHVWRRNLRDLLPLLFQK